MSNGAAAAEAIELERLPRQPWRNGAGLTREIAASPPAPAGFDWRLSIAEVDRDAPFSAFDGIDRCIVLLGGAGMLLRSPSADVEHRLVRIGAPFSFAGEQPIEARLLDGATTDLNVMTRRGAWRSRTIPLIAATRLDAADAAFVLPLRGTWRIGADRVGPGHARLWRAAAPALELVPEADAGEPLLIAVQLHREPAR